MLRFVLSHEATGDLQEVYDHLAAALRWLVASSNLRTAMLGPSGLGHLRDHLDDEASWVRTVHSYLMIYRPDTRPLQVVRVLSGYRDIAGFFE